MSGRIIPETSKISRPFWESCHAQAMKIQKCDDCSYYIYYPVYICPECASRQLTWTPVCGRGTVYTYTASDKSIFGDEPIIVALVELEEGAMLMSNIVNAVAADIRIGMPVRLTYLPISNDFTLPVFEPAL